jgi:hypothetical protein
VGERTHCGALLSEFFGKGLLQNGWVHTDLHPKNWGYRPESRDLVVYDYGATFKLEPSVIAVMNELARGVHASPEQALEAFQKVGFKRAALWEIREKLPELAYRLFEPLHEITGVDYTHWSIGEDAERLLGNKKWAFRAAGPPWFLMIIRGFTGWLHGMHELEVRLSLRHLIGESHWGPEWAKIKENDPLPKVSGPITANPSTHLKVRVMDGTTEIVALEFPSLTVESLEDLIPDEILVQLRADGLDLAGIRQRAISTGLSPQLLFEKKLGTKTCRVWIE